MEDNEFSAAFCRFIQTSVPSVDAAELLLLFHASPGKSMSLEEATAKPGPGMDREQALKQLAGFESCGVLSNQDGRYRYRPGSPLAGFVDTLAQAYSERPVTLVRIIYALQDSKIQSFADAFKLRRN
jgi:hypothetical protein